MFYHEEARPIMLQRGNNYTVPGPPEKNKIVPRSARYKQKM
jgi:hypothetical protein